MNEHLYDIEYLFHDAIEGQGELPPDHVWDNIDRTLDKISFADTQIRYKRLKRFSILLAVFSVGVLIFVLLQMAPIASPFTSGVVRRVATNPTKQARSLSVPEGGPKITGRDTLAGNPKIAKNPLKRTDSMMRAPSLPIATWSKQAEQPAYSTDSLQGSNKRTSDISWTPTTEKAADAKITRGGRNQPISSIARMQPDGSAGIDAILKAGGNNGSGKLQTAREQRERAYSKNKPRNGNFSPSGPGVEQANINNDMENPVHQDLKTRQLKEINIEQRRLPLMITSSGSKIRPFVVTIRDDAAKPGMVMIKDGIAHTVAKTRRGFRFSLTPYYAPFFYFQRIADDGQHRPGGPGRNDADHIKHDENEINAGSLGINIQVPLKKRWSLQSGIAYATRSERIDGKRIYASADNNGTAKYRLDFSSGFVYVLPKTGSPPAVGDSIMTSGSSTHLAYLTVPIAVGYTFGKRKFNIIPSAGAVINMLIHDKVQTGLVAIGSDEKHEIASIQGLKKVYVQSVTGLTFQYNMRRRISLSITPAINFALGSTTSNSSVKSYPNAFSVAAGLRFYF